MTKAVTKRQEEIMLRVLKYIKEEPDRLDMRSWGELHPTCGIHKPVTHTSGRRQQPIPPCGTTACFGGTVLLVTKKGRQFIEAYVADPTKPREVYYRFPHNSSRLAREILNLTEKQAGDLFYFKSWGTTIDVGDFKTVRIGWPTQFSKMYNQAKTGKERYKALEARVKHFIRTGL